MPMRRIFRALHRRTRGAAAVEFALVLLPLLAILFGTLSGGLYFLARDGVNAAAREGARVASLPTTTSEEVVVRVDAALAGLPVTDVATAVTPGPCAGRSGDNVTVTVSAGFPGPLSFGIFPERIEGQGTFRCE